MDFPGSSDIMIIGGNSHPELLNLITNRLGVKSGGCAVYHKTNRETMVEIGDSVRGKDIYIIQTGTKDVNNNIMELLIMAYACKTSSAKSIVGVIPYLPYSKQCKMRKRGCIVSKLLAKMMCKSGLSHVITMDLHQKEIQGFFDCPVDNLRASPFLLQYIQECIPDYRNAVIVARNPGSAKKATSYAERLRLGIAVIHGEQKEAESDMVDGRYSPPTLPRSRTMDVSVGVPAHPAKEKPPINVVGDVGGRIAIMVDDMVDDVQSFVAAAEVLKERGAYKIYVLATHGLLSSDAPRLIEDSPIDEEEQPDYVPEKRANTTPSSNIPTRKKTKNNMAAASFELIKTCTSALQQCNKVDIEEHETIGINIGKKLQRMNPVQAIYAESLINSVVKRGLLNTLQPHTDVCDNLCNIKMMRAPSHSTTSFTSDNST